MDEETRAAIYVRVSTAEQNTGPQETELTRYAQRRGWTVYKVYRDKGQSGAKLKRPALDELMTDCRHAKFDVVLVWRFDRFARSVKHLVDALQEFEARAVQFVSYTENVDTTTPNGALIFHIFAAVAQFERALISERVKAGLVHARSIGKRLGRPPVRELTAQEIEALKGERENGGTSFRDLARKYGITLWMAHRFCKRLEARV